MALATAVGRLARPGCVIALHGNLGAGKTRFAQGIARGLGAKGLVTSPTFTLINEYQGRGGIPFYHVDCYRLDEKAMAAFVLSLDELMGGMGVMVIEWAERLQRYLPPDHLWVEIQTAGNGGRLFTFNGYGPAAVKLLQRLEKELS